MGDFFSVPFFASMRCNFARAPSVVVVVWIKKVDLVLCSSTDTKVIVLNEVLRGQLTDGGDRKGAERKITLKTFGCDTG